MNEMKINVALDGPSGAGKSTIAKAVAKKLEYVYVDTGALYRALAYHVISTGTDLKDEAAVVSSLDNINVELKYIGGAQHVMLEGEDVSDKIRTPEISMGASAVSAIPKVRELLLDLQKDIARKNNIIMDGRDIGTVVLPKAQVKIFLTATAEERANRRFKELQEKGDPSTYEQVLEDIKQRDYNDTHRDIAPLKKADDAVEVDSTKMTLDEVIDEIVRIIREKTGESSGNSSGEKTSLRATRELMPVRPISKKKKLTFIKLFFYNLLRYITIFVYKCYYNIKWEGKENVPKDGGNIFASNHRSYQDPVFTALGARVPISYMAKEELFHKNVFFTGLIKLFGAFPVVRGKGDMQVIDTSIEKLEKGRNLEIFPEGTRSKDGKVGKGKTGVALIAAVAQTKVIPVGINFQGEKLKFRSKVIVRYGKPIIPSEIGVTGTSAKDLKKIKNEIMKSITELVH
jgi:cytidylate kinase